MSKIQETINELCFKGKISQTCDGFFEGNKEPYSEFKIAEVNSKTGSILIIYSRRLDGPAKQKICKNETEAVKFIKSLYK